MLEFMLVLPVFIFFVFFTIDVGRLVLIRAQLQDATQQAARAGAQVGGNTAVSTAAFGNNLNTAAFIDSSKALLTVTNNCNPNNGDTNNLYKVRAQSSYTTTLTTPGLGAVFNVVSKSNASTKGSWTLTAVSSARCEVGVPS
jgi:Flp pilus assembly protein TadG